METPIYRYNLSLLKQTINEVSAQALKYGFAIHYAVKANSNPYILKIIAKKGMGADCVSGNEIRASLKAGFNPNDIVFAGVGKTNDEIKFAIQSGIHCIHIESLEELMVANQIASHLGAKMQIALRLNPDIDSGTHRHITTGTHRNKFGLSNVELSDALQIIPSLNAVKLIGFHFHIGSQIQDLSKFAQLAIYASRVYEENRNLSLQYLNLGGGLGIDYESPDKNPIPNFSGYFEIISRNLNIPKQIKVHLEPGRSIVAQCGELITKVLFIKKGYDRLFAVVDAGMNNLIRPALYQAKHRIQRLNSTSNDCEMYDVVGPICESSDVFAAEILLPKLTRGDLLAIQSAGAYGESMSSLYNLRGYTPCIFVKDKKEVTV